MTKRQTLACETTCCAAMQNCHAKNCPSDQLDHSWWDLSHIIRDTIKFEQNTYSILKLQTQSMSIFALNYLYHNILVQIEHNYNTPVYSHTNNLVRLPTSSVSNQTPTNDAPPQKKIILCSKYFKTSPPNQHHCMHHHRSIQTSCIPSLQHKYS